MEILGIIGTLGFIGCLGWLVYTFIKHRPKKWPGIGLGISFGLIILGSALIPPPDPFQEGMSAYQKSDFKTALSALSKVPESDTSYSQAKLYLDSARYHQARLDSIKLAEKEAQRLAKEEVEKLVLPDYTLLDEEVYDVPVKTQVEISLLVSGNITEEGIEVLLNRLYDKTIKKTGFEYHPHPTAVYIYAYTSKKDAESAKDQWIALLQKAHAVPEPVIMVDTVRLRYLKAEPEEKFGLSEEKRKMIYQEMIKIDRRALEEATQKYFPPNVAPTLEQREKAGELMEELQDKYKDKLAKSYGLTYEQQDSIAIEGLEKEWPLPPPK